MKAFISYSLNDSEQYVISLLAVKLGEQGFSATGGAFDGGNQLENGAIYAINSSHLLIGIITESGERNRRVLNEWRYAIENKIPAILLVEDMVKIAPELARHPNVVRFNRVYPHAAIQTVKNKIGRSRRTSGNKLEETVPWILGGMAVIKLIGMVSKN